MQQRWQKVYEEETDDSAVDVDDVGDANIQNSYQETNADRCRKVEDFSNIDSALLGLGPSKHAEKSLFAYYHELGKDRVKMNQIDRLYDLNFPGRLPKIALNSHLRR
jgi:hypothetical protein